MLTESKSFLLKDGRKALLRSPKKEDAQGLLDYLFLTSQETEFVIRYPEECKDMTPEGEVRWIESANSSEDGAILVCEVDGKIAGNCEIRRTPKLKLRHRASIGIALLREFWGQGIGTKMFEEMIRIAEGLEGVTQLELEFIEGNARARALYEKMGFRIAGVHPNAIRLKDGSFRNNYLMIRKMN